MLTNYGPIALLPSLFKLFEQLICKTALSSFFICNNTIDPTQYGFKPNRSAIHATLDLITSCLDNINKKRVFNYDIFRY